MPIQVVTAQFDTTGSVQDFVVPAGVDSVTVTMWGAGGGNGYSTDVGNCKGGGGGFVSGVLPVTPGETLKVVVGQAGGRGSTTDSGRRRFGWGGDATVGDGSGGESGNPGEVGNYGGGGGGRSAIVRLDGGSPIQLMTAGGGGGGSGDNSGQDGGAAGGLTGQEGQFGISGGSGTETFDGKGGDGSNNGGGSAFKGGGGGGGFDGGNGGTAGGSLNANGGGGGNSVIHESVQAPVNEGGSREVPGGTSNALYTDPVAYGGHQTTPGEGVTTVPGRNGRVFIQYLDLSEVTEIVAIDASGADLIHAIRTDINAEDRVFYAPLLED